MLEAYAGRWLNVHPSLLPAFPGMHGVADALAYGVKVTGVTVFLVDEGLDTGPVVLQEAIAVREDDDWDSLEARVHEVEHRLLPAAAAALVEGRMRVDGRKVTIEGRPT
jgi:phosphoribosylglycinamide formyltransferase-1